MSNFTAVPYSGYGSQGLQVFTPALITLVNAGESLDTTYVSCIRLPEPVSCKLNGEGESFTLPAGCTGISKQVTSIQFESETTVEIMSSGRDLLGTAKNTTTTSPYTNSWMVNDKLSATGVLYADQPLTA